MIESALKVNSSMEKCMKESSKMESLTDKVRREILFINGSSFLLSNDIIDF